jgi:DNA-binding LytR/AlgR family response regulator
MCCVEGNYTIVCTTNKEEKIVKIFHKIAFIEKKYQTDEFFRCHKTYMINLKHLDKLISKTHHVQMTGGFIIPLSDDCWKKLRHLSEENFKESE